MGVGGGGGGVGVEEVGRGDRCGDGGLRGGIGGGCALGDRRMWEGLVFFEDLCQDWGARG